MNDVINRVVVKRYIRQPICKCPSVLLGIKARDIKPNAARAWVQRDVVANNVLVWVHNYLRAFAARLIARFSCLVISLGTIRADIW